MSELLQSGQHLDADQVSALVDHALPPHEREAVLAHLAVCGECRDTVALVSPPMEARPAKDVKEKRSRWFFNLSVLAPVAAAGLAAILLYVHFAARPHGGSTGPEPQVAREAPPPQIQVPIAPIDQTNKPAASAKTPSPSASESGLEKKPSAAPTERNTPALDAMMASNAEQATTGSKSLTGNQLAAPAATPQAKAAQAQQAMNGPTGTHNGLGGGLNLGGPVKASPPVPVQLTAQAGIPLDSGSHTDVLTSKDIDTLAVEGRDTTELLKVLPGAVTASHFPGGAALVSSATRGRQILAIGVRNKVYLSNDGGTTWTRVRVPWKSHAVKAEVVSYSDRSRKKEAAEVRGKILDGVPLADSESAAPTPPQPVAAQNLPAAPPGSLVGTISDDSGGTIPNAEVTVTNSTTHVTQVAATDANGQYRMDGLTPGDYDIKASARGFEASVTSMQVASNRVNVANFALQVGAETLTVTVSSTEEIIPTTSPVSNEVISSPGDKHAESFQASPPANGLFQITTKNGERWTSADGLTWQRK